MIWLVTRGASYQITSCNIVEKDGLFQMWVERNNGKGLKVLESKDEELVREHKNAIDHAIKLGAQTFELEV